jgi:hypothetical protein
MYIAVATLNNLRRLGVALSTGGSSGRSSGRTPAPLGTSSPSSWRSGVLISSVAFELMGESYESGGFGASAFGLLAGAVVYFAADRTVSRRAKHRKRSLGQQ